MRPELGMCVYKMSVKNVLGGTCVFACMCTRLHAHAPSVHYWPAAGGHILNQKHTKKKLSQRQMRLCLDYYYVSSVHVAMFHSMLS